MSLLQTVAPDTATGPVAATYAQIRAVWGSVPTAIQLFSPSPFLLQHQWDYYASVLQHPTLSPALLTCIRMLVSIRGQCDYCIDMNAGLLIQMCQWTPDQVAATRADYRQSPLAEREQILLGLVLKATQTPTDVTANDLNVVRAAGWSDGELLDAVNHGARMVAGDILINTFKVERDF